MYIRVCKNIIYFELKIILEKIIFLPHLYLKSMKAIKYFLLTAALFIQSNSYLQAQSTSGTEFWVTFGQNEFILNANTNVLELHIRIVNGDKKATGSIHFTHLETDTDIDFEINPFETFTHSLDPAQKVAAYNTQSVVTNKSIHIVSNAPVTVFAFTYRAQASSDVTNVLPVTSLSKEYYHISHNSAPNSSDAYVVIATQHNTLLYHNGDSIATLNLGEVYYKSSGADMTGAKITSNNPIAFYAVHQNASIPYYFIKSCLMQQLAPINTWDKSFFVPVTIHNKNFVRIVASQDNTAITQTGGTIRTDWGGQPFLTNLQAGQFVELEVCIDSAGCSINANKPVGICSYIPDHTIAYKGLPAQCWIPGVKQSVTRAVIAPFIPLGWDPFTHYALLITPTATKNHTKVSINGAAPESLPDDSWSDHIHNGMSFYNMQLSSQNTVYSFINPAGITLLGYATGKNNNLISYYYLAYSAMRDLDAAFYANDIHYQDLKNTLFCTKNVNFRAEIEEFSAGNDHVKWYIDRNDGNGFMEETGFQDALTWSNLFENGIYQIKMEILYNNGGTKTLVGTFKINAGFFKIRNVRD